MRDVKVDLEPRQKKQDKEIIKLSKEQKKEQKRLKTILDAIEDARKKVSKLFSPCKILRTEEELVEYIDFVLSKGECAIDTETTGLNIYKDMLVGVSMYAKGKEEIYIPIAHRDYITGKILPNQMPLDVLVRELNRLQNILIDMHHANFDLRVFNRVGIKLKCTWDTLVMSHLLDENEDHGLKPQHQKHLLKNKTDEYSANKIFDLKTITFADIPIEVAAPYAGHDAKITHELKDWQFDVFRNNPSLKPVWGVFQNIEMPLMDVVTEMEDIGFVFDYDWHKYISPIYHQSLKEEEDKVNDELKKMQPKIDAWRKTEDAQYKEQLEWVEPVYNKNGTLKKHTGEYKYAKSKSEQLTDPIKISSPTQLAILLYDVLKYPVVDKKHPRGTGKDILKAMNTDFTKMILGYREYSKLIEAFIDKLPEEVVDGVVHYNLNAQGTATGRFSCIAKGTYVETRTGKKRIEDISKDSYVYCYNKKGNLTVSRVLNTFKNGKRNCIELTWLNSMGNTGKLVCTPDHFILTDRGWKMANNLTANDTIYHLHTGNKKAILFNGNVDDAVYKVVSIEPIGKREVYDLEVADHHNFIANDLCVHNCSSPNLQQIPSSNEDIRKLFRAPLYLNDIDIKANTIYTFKDTEEIEIDGKWVLVRNLKEGNKIGEFTIYKIETEGHNIKIYVV